MQETPLDTLELEISTKMFHVEHFRGTATRLAVSASGRPKMLCPARSPLRPMGVGSFKVERLKGTALNRVNSLDYQKF
jgi:hypothetical protein